MANIIDPHAVRFANENCRVMADMLQAAYRTAKQFALNVADNFESHTGGNANGDVIVDGSEVDGRPGPRTKYNVGELKYVCEQFAACMETDDRLAIVGRWAVNGLPRF